jgi:hypothetical protein
MPGQVAFSTPVGCELSWVHVRSVHRDQSPRGDEGLDLRDREFVGFVPKLGVVRGQKQVAGVAVWFRTLVLVDRVLHGEPVQAQHLHVWRQGSNRESSQSSSSGG